MINSGCAEISDIVTKLDGTKLSFGKVDSIVLSVMKKAEIPGLQLTIFNDGKVNYMKSFGFRDSLKTLPFDNNTVVVG